MPDTPDLAGVSAGTPGAYGQAVNLLPDLLASPSGLLVVMVTLLPLALAETKWSDFANASLAISAAALLSPW